MAKKRNPKASAGPKSPSIIAPSQNATTSSKPKIHNAKSTPPSPYSIPPPSLASFLSTLNPAHVYITHIDTHPWIFKRRIFIIPIVMNIVIAILLFFRLRSAVPTYVSIALATLGVDNDARVDYYGTPWPPLIRIALKRTAMFMLDFCLARFAVPWPVDFFISSGNVVSPFEWRRKIGFQDREVVVRVSRIWDTMLPKNWLAEEADDDGTVYREHIMPGIDRAYVREKTGYLMLNKSWDLDFRSMVLAHSLVAAGECTTSDFEKTVIAYSEDFGWLIWPVWRLDEGGGGGAEDSVQDEGRQKIVALKEKLTAMGKENLFFRWVELLQYETSQPGGFTEERQLETLRKAKKVFEDQGVDFDRLWDEIGGPRGMPGMR